LVGVTLLTAGITVGQLRIEFSGTASSNVTADGHFACQGGDCWTHDGSALRTLQGYDRDVLLSDGKTLTFGTGADAVCAGDGTDVLCDLASGAAFAWRDTGDAEVLAVAEDGTVEIGGVDATPPIRSTQFVSAGVDQQTGSVTYVTFATTSPIAPAAIGAGTTIRVTAVLENAGVNGTDDVDIRVTLGGAPGMNPCVIASPVFGRDYTIAAEFFVVAEGVAAPVYGRLGCTAQVGNEFSLNHTSLFATTDTTGALVAQVDVRWDSASASNKLDLLMLRTEVIRP